MQQPSLIDQYVAAALAGNRINCRTLIQQQSTQLDDPAALYQELLWPAMERIDKLYRSDRINAATEHLATRINRSVADQLQLRLRQSCSNGKRIVVMCADGEPEELGAQMCADLLESQGWEVYFLGGGVPNDEVLTLVGQLTPAVLLIFGTQPTGVPEVRKMIEHIRDIGVNPTMNILVSGGVFNRAQGLWKEVGADLYASSAFEALPLVEESPPRIPTIRPAGAPKKRRRRRRNAVLQEA